VVATPASVPGATGKAATPPKLNEVMSRQELEKARQDNIKRMMGKLAEDALHAAGPSPEYQGRIRARIKPHIVYVDTQGGNPMTTVLVHCAPDGKIISAKVTIPSGSAAWDRAVLRALERTAVLPRNEQGKVLTPLQLEFKPRDF
jgi:colicin import membrane protein